MSSFLAGHWLDDGDRIVVRDRYTGEAVGDVRVPTSEQIEQAVSRVAREQQQAHLAPHRRAEVLSRAARLIEERREHFIDTVLTETGFTRSESAGEVDRAVTTLQLSSEEAVRLGGEIVSLGGTPAGDGRLAYTVHHPIGVVCAITPFNAPLNTVAHKVGPAIAAGNGVVLKPAEATPLTAVRLVEVLIEAGLPPALIALLHGPGETTGRDLLEDERIGFYAFTGSTRVGRHILATVGLRRTQLELGSIASTIICGDADLDAALPRCVRAGFRKAGQVCTSIQRLYVHDAVLDEVTDRFVAEAERIRPGDPRDPETGIGPLITQADARRVEQSVTEAVDGGGRLLTGGIRDSSLFAPTVLTDVDPSAAVLRQEVFGPVVTIIPFEDLDVAIDDANATPYGLAAGIFTRDIGRGLHAAERLRMGSVHINETSSSRLDVLPYGGVKDSGWGEEGPRQAVREMSEQRVVTVRYR